MGLLTLAERDKQYVCDRRWEELVWGKGKPKEPRCKQEYMH